ncbi:hypothetical protein [Paraburkholderia acidisoli]|uniref:Uncharacterized protein n=1 Tax=Paraburkholderia acidisoli TaxID=2571748 RepID=A0A7Z2GJS2_9BURK|nr:hypothetical protein [Paraburkholderia acidisoli]QGZ63123.1 hypothetical protein FAZ98_15020 [Paraburkholderia acidisoli]
MEAGRRKVKASASEYHGFIGRNAVACKRRKSASWTMKTGAANRDIAGLAFLLRLRLHWHASIVAYFSPRAVIPP